MSYRELRNFTETLRLLGYPRLISIENFRVPNFTLVAEMLAWLLKRYDPDYEISLQLDTEQDRVIFIKTAALFLIQRARIRVNPKKLYQADGYAVQELLKVTRVLYDAVNNQYNSSATTDTAADGQQSTAVIANQINAKMNDLRLCRQLAAEIPEKGASLYDLLSKEVELREQRQTALARPLELSDVERSIRSSIKAVEDETKQTLANLNNIASDEQTLDAKMEKKRADLDRQQKRLSQIQTVRPAYMDEYEKLEERLKQMYQLYVLKFRNLAYLQKVQSEFDKADAERTMEAEASLRKMAEKVRLEEMTRLAAAEKLDTAAIDGGTDYSDGAPSNPAPKVYGNITGAGLSDEEDDAEDDSLLSDDDDDEENEGPAGGLRSNLLQQRKGAIEQSSDDDEFVVGGGVGGAAIGGRGAIVADDTGEPFSDDVDMHEPPAPPTTTRHSSATKPVRPNAAVPASSASAPVIAAAENSDDDF